MPDIHTVLRLRLLLLLFGVMIAAGSGLSACSSSTEATSTISDSVYVEVMVELLQLKSPANTDTSYLGQQRRAILARFSVTLEDLEVAAAQIAKDPDSASALWSVIRRRVSGSM